MAFRSSIQDFALANNIYIGAVVAFYTVNSSGQATSTLAPLYADPTSSTQLPNPQILDSTGKFTAPVYISQPVIGEVQGPSISTHSTGIINSRGTWRGNWVTATQYYSTDLVQDPASNNVYIATTDYVSGASVAADVSAGNLDLILPPLPTASLFYFQTPITGAYAVATSDLLKSIIATSGFYTISLGAPAGYASTFVCTISNNDSSAAKWISVSGGTSFYLWPNQTTLAYLSGGAWKFWSKFQPWIKGGSGINLFVDNVAGSDVPGVADGLSTGARAFATIAHAIAIYQDNFMVLGFGFNINLPTTTSTPITENVSFEGLINTPGYVQNSIIGNPSNPALCQWQIGGDQSAIICDDYFSLGVNGISFSSTGSNSSFINAGHGQFDILDITNNIFGTNADGLAISAGPNTCINIGGGNTISGSCGAFIDGDEGATIECNVPIAISGTPDVTYFFILNRGARADIGSLSFTGATTGITGSKFYVQNGSRIFGDSLVTWPANMTAGTVVTGAASDNIAISGGSLLSSGPSGGVGYATGAGGTVTQATSKSTGVTLNTACGQITMNNAALAAGAAVTFLLTDSAIAATDVVIVNHIGGGSFGNYSLQAASGAGGADISVRNVTAGSLSDAIVIQFAVIKGVDS
jgi:hypothetical protein